MKSKILIGESGGSKTDWALIVNGQLQWQIATVSFHPSNWSTELFNELLYDLLEKNVDFQNTNLKFFGAGCNGSSNSEKIANYFSLFGFRNVEVHGDLVAAGIATLKTENGWVAILGSGSVLIDFQKGKVNEYFGGLGRRMGDEGGGYYAGKLIAEAYAKKTLTPNQELILTGILSPEDKFILDGKEIQDDFLLKLPKLLSRYLLEFEDIHIHNLDLFFQKYVATNLTSIRKIHFVGSYAFFHQDIIKSYFRKKGIETGVFVERPMQNLIDYYLLEYLNL